ncbi:MAG: hypothetical protein COW24_05635 [Candidatus Kerfeldbacteria bacterium CG15_BIG_FIL_POST_REV_8_21_14_020_45_12]|uniref:Uncharacterized protein n=1 Tax=Candidatus Kerfeldbacteria bacterium CG15_BIG_FIL_POST_REV_8_21_14_020_45_12 TaxID=2014247 RepID=A0A2M7H2C3_9BACT|nr:MAG: hypothetical protein COW24_05635 [Candidatus Kerfeldbacteria bacterium CG15_BIG_FIL_POST_REV_8_21_14_020_45_12]PJA93420.1 MAG: hypothetical protein CO132_02915 [Candidatus Kerfeldbacteria bacterium CG_4_9_14_3_um_filter_45_8]
MVYVTHTTAPSNGRPSNEFQPSKRRGRLREVIKRPKPSQAKSTMRWFVGGTLVGAITFIIIIAIALQRLNALFL